MSLDRVCLNRMLAIMLDYRYPDDKRILPEYPLDGWEKPIHTEYIFGDPANGEYHYILD